MPVDSLPSVPSHRPVAQPLLAWYDASARRLPWRAPPGAAPADPYAVWLSEIMLQQTTVTAATPYFERFLARWPTVAALAAADEAEVMAAWAGLGYYARARNLVACARRVAGGPDGRFPDTEQALRALPGIGAYTAAAIAAIAFGRRAVVVDANVERVVARLFAIDTPLPQAKRAIHAAADAITPDARAGDFAQAMMDLGSAICTPRTPRCPACPVRTRCAGLASGTPERFPVKPAKRARPLRHGTAWWIESDAGVWLVTRPAGAMLGDMRALPDDGWRAGEDGSADPPVAAEWRMVPAVVQHGFTHFALRLRIATARVAMKDMAGQEGTWWPRDRLAEAGLPTLFAKAAALALKETT